jgi:hypothetical protein
MKLSWEDINTWLYWIATSLAASVVFLIRKVLTNERQIELLQKEIALRESHNREKFNSINEGLSEIRSDIKQLIGRE